MSALLAINDLRKRFHTPHGFIHAVDGISFEIYPGETVALVGESGCGKSTVALSLLRLIDADSGNILFDGSEVTSTDGDQLRKLRQQLSIVFQNPYSSLNPKMRVQEIVGEPLKTCFGVKGRQLVDRVTGHLGDVGLGPEHLRRFPHEFSGGQRQRIAIARALALEPKLLILDEPTAALDVSVQAQVLNLLRSLQQRLGLAYLFISHNLATGDFISNRVLVMYLGQIVESGKVNDVFSRPQHPYTEALLNSVPSADPRQRDQLAPLTGDVPSPLKRAPGCGFAPRCLYATDRCRREEPTLNNDDSLHAVACFNPLQGETGI